MIRSALLLALVAALAFTAQAAGTAASIRPPDAKALGLTLAKWTKGYFFYDAAIPVVDGSHPSIDTGDVDCGVGQWSRKVWILETTFDLDSDIVRRCAVPKGVTLYVPVIQWICSPELFDGEPIADCLAAADAAYQELELSLTVDGATVDDDGLESYRVSTGEFEVPLVENNIWEYVFGMDFGDSLTFGADAVGALVGPLAAGEHEIVVSYGSEAFGFEGSLTYELTAGPIK